MFERDRGEMPVHRRKSKDQTYYAKKMLTYHEANRVGEHVRELGLPNFRVADGNNDAGAGRTDDRSAKGNDERTWVELVSIYR